MRSRTDIIAQIKALLAKTVAAGCTEAEAMAALAKARGMMDDYDVGDADLAFDGEQVAAETVGRSDRDRVRDRLCMAVGKFCHCETWGGFETVTFCGMHSETLFAHWLLDTLADFVGRELAAYLERTWRPGFPRVRRRESDGFAAGCCDRLNERLHALCARAPHGRGLVVARTALIRSFLDRNGLTIVRGRGRFRLVDAHAAGAGADAADRARFDRPLNARRAAALISHRGS